MKKKADGDAARLFAAPRHSVRRATESVTAVRSDAECGIEERPLLSALAAGQEIIRIIRSEGLITGFATGADITLRIAATRRDDSTCAAEAVAATVLSVALVHEISLPRTLPRDPGSHALRGNPLPRRSAAFFPSQDAERPQIYVPTLRVGTRLCPESPTRPLAIPRLRSILPAGRGRGRSADIACRARRARGQPLRSAAEFGQR